MTLLERKMLEQILQTRLEDEVTVRQMKIIVLALRASFSEMDQIAMDAQGKGDDTLLNTFARSIDLFAQLSLSPFIRLTEFFEPVHETTSVKCC